MKYLAVILALFSSLSACAQVVIDGKDANELEILYVYAFKKPFSTKESLFANTGDNNFRLHFYDSKRQAIHDASGKKFQSGQYLELFRYLRAQGWKQTGQHEEQLGDNKGRVVIFERVE